MSLKGSNNFTLLTVLFVNLAIFAAVVGGTAIVELNADELIRNWTKVLPAGAAVIVVGIVNALPSATAKTRLVFMRWRDPLPGCRAFSELAGTDSRISLPRLKAKLGKFPKAAGEQNALWYSIYKSMESDPAVEQVHRNYLLTRDYTFLALLMGLFLGALAFIYLGNEPAAYIYAFFLIAQFIVVSRAARTHGYRFVTTVLARKCAEQEN